MSVANEATIVDRATVGDPGNNFLQKTMIQSSTFTSLEPRIGYVEKEGPSAESQTGALARKG